MNFECVSIIFHEPPVQWGFRGDPYLWRELDTHFSNMLLPCSVQLFLKEFYSAFEQFTGSRLDSKEDIFVPRYDHGGMSTGMVSLNFWSEEALPLLIQRLRQANSRGENEMVLKEIPNSKLKLKDIPKKFNVLDFHEFALSFNGYKFAGDVCLSYPQQVESYFEEHRALPGHLTLSELRLCLFFLQRRFNHNGYLPSPDYIEHLYNAIRERVSTKTPALPVNQHISFGLYNRRATFFDLIDGDWETKQTKGLAYLFSSCPKFLELFIDNTLSSHGVSTRNFDYIAVDAERMSVDSPPLRRDITMSCYVQNIKKCVIVVEAKSIKGPAVDTLESQLRRYMDVRHYPQDSGIPIIGISLTKHRYVFDRWSPMVSVTWIELIQWLWDFVSDEGSDVAKEYLDFLTKVEHGMHFYEAEVLSIAAQNTEKELKEFHIYACANHKKRPSALFMAFRGKGGVMDTLYKVDQVFVADPKHPSFEEKVSFLSEAEKHRVLGFVEKRMSGYGFDDEDYRFYILSETEKILLPHKPRPKVANQIQRRYSLATILSGEEML